ncbi:hypothetical protein WA026_020436, partial [Henosepilachna vigintioctopunctata]
LGFRVVRSTENALANLIRNIYNAVIEGTPTICVFIDLAKTFDAVSRPLLLKIIGNLGFRGSNYNAMKNCFKDRE